MIKAPNQNLSEKMKWIKFSGILRYKQITESQPEDQVLIDKRKRTFYPMDVAVLMDYSAKMTDSKKIEIYLNLSRELKTMLSMSMMMVLLVISALGTVFKGLIKLSGGPVIKGRMENI